MFCIFSGTPPYGQLGKKKYGHLVITTTFFRPGKTAIHFLITSPYYCKLFPIFTSLHALLTITVVTVLRTAQIAESRFSFQSCFKVLKDHQEMTGLLIEISLLDLRVDSIVQCVCFLPFVSIAAFVQCVCL